MAMNPSMDEASSSSSSTWQSVPRSKSIIQSLSSILSHQLSDESPSSLLNDASVFSLITCRLRHVSSGSGSDDLCRWIYETFQSNVSDLQLVIVSYVPVLTGVYLSRSISSKETLAGFEAVLLALYSHEMVNRGAEPVTVRLPNIRISGAAESSKASGKGKGVATEPDLTEATLSPVLEPCSTIRSTRRARIVSVTLQLYYSKISLMPNFSKLEFCKTFIAWAGPERQSLDDIYKDEGKQEEQEEETKGQRVPLTWELYQPVLRILGHCLMGPTGSDELIREIGLRAAKCVYARAMKDFDSKAILASRSLVRVGSMMQDPIPEPTFSGTVENIAELEAMRETILSR